MIKKYSEFLNEFYIGPNATAGFKTSEPTDNFTLDVMMKHDPWNEELIQEILKKYNVTYTDLSLKGEGGNQRLKLNFLAYNEYEAAAVINAILKELGDKQVNIDNSTINVSSEIKKYIVPDETAQRSIVTGFKKY